MTDTILTTPAPAYVQIAGNNHHGNHGLSDKDRMALNSDFFNNSFYHLGHTVNSTAATTQIAVEKTGAANELATEKVGAANNLANALGFTNTQNILINGFKDSRYDVCQSTAQIQQLAAFNAAALAKSLEECCCEIKRIVLEEAGKTRDLVSSVNADNLAIQLVDAKNAILALQSKAKV